MRKLISKMLWMIIVFSFAIFLTGGITNKVYATDTCSHLSGWTALEIVYGSCRGDGYNKSQCNSCGYIQTTVLAANPNYHPSYTSFQTLREKTCVVGGLYLVDCDYCGGDVHEVETPPYSSTGTHTWGAWSGTDATCTSDGYKRRDCNVCSEYETQTITKLGHSYGSWVTTSTGSCTTNGTQERTCSRCNNVETQTIAGTGHDYETTYTTIKEATCTTTGTKVRYCKNCTSYTDSQTIAATGHSYSYVTTTADCTTGSYKIGTCSKCNNTTSQLVSSALGHSYPTYYTQVSQSGCDVTYAKVCTRCGNYGDTFTGKSHTYGSYTQTVSPTCTEVGTKRRICSVCSTYDYADVEALGHSMGTAYVSKAATCTATGTSRTDCQRSGCTYYTTSTIAALGHSYTYACTTCSSANQRCSRCSNIQLHTVSVPSVTTSFTYNGSTKTAVSDTSYYTLSGTASAIAAGSYSVTVSLDNTSIHKWSDNTTANKSYTWKINTAAMSGTITITGTNKFDEVLNAITANMTQTGCTINYKWYTDTDTDKSGGTLVQDSSSNQLTVLEEYLDLYIYVVATVSKTNYTTFTMSDITDDTNNENAKVEPSIYPIIMTETEENVYTNKYILGNSSISVRRENISAITIVDSKASSAPTTAVDGIMPWDASLNRDNSVIAWLESTGNGMYELNIGGYRGIQINEGSYLFANYPNCTAINNTNLIDTRNAVSMHSMFKDDTNLTTLNLANVNTSKFVTTQITDMHSMFENCTKLATINLTYFDTTNVTDMSSMFKGCNALSNLNISGLSTAKVTTMKDMFNGCSTLASLSITHFNTAAVKDMSGMFKDCSKLTTLNLSSFNTAQVTTMQEMFKNCTALTNLTTSSFNTANVITMKEMFNNCSSLKTLSLTNFNTANVQYMNGMFDGCIGLTSLNLAGLNTAKVVNMSSMFRNCSSLASLSVTSFNTSSAKTIARMFEGCSSLTGLDLSTFNLSTLDSQEGSDIVDENGVTDINNNNMLKGCSNLVSVLLGKDFIRLDGKDMFSGCTKLEAIIAQSESPLTLGTETSLAELTKLYVQNTTIEDAYESATNYESVFGAKVDGDIDRVRPMIELIGAESITLEKDEPFINEEVTVAGFTLDRNTNYTQYGYTIKNPVIMWNGSSVSSVNVANAGTYEYTYVLGYNNASISIPDMTVTRTIIVLQRDLKEEGADIVLSIPNEVRIYKDDVFKPVVTLTERGNILVEDEDFKVEYFDNVNHGTARILVTGIRNFYGTLETTFDISQRPITITAGSATKVYDYTPLTSEEYSTSNSPAVGNLVSGHTLSAITSGEITDVGEVDNVIDSYTIANSSGDVTENYAVTLEVGKLKVTPATITGSVVIEGINRVCDKLTAVIETKPTDVDIRYDWYMSSTAMSGGTLLQSDAKNTYVIEEKTVGYYIYVVAVVERENYFTAEFKDVTDADKNTLDLTGVELLSEINAVLINGGKTTSKNVDVTVQIDAANTVTMCVKEDGTVPTDDEFMNYQKFVKLSLSTGNGEKTIHVWGKNKHGKISEVTKVIITMEASYTLTVTNNQIYTGEETYTVSYAVKPEGGTYSAWQESNVFTGLEPNVIYYVKTKIEDATGLSDESEETMFRAVYNDSRVLVLEKL